MGGCSPFFPRHLSSRSLCCLGRREEGSQSDQARTDVRGEEAKTEKKRQSKPMAGVIQGHRLTLGSLASRRTMNSTHIPETGADSGISACPGLLSISWGWEAVLVQKELNNEDERLAVWDEDAAPYTAS